MDSDEDFLDSESAFKLEMDVEGLMSVVRSTEDSVVTEVGDRWMTMVLVLLDRTEDDGEQQHRRDCSLWSVVGPMKRNDRDCSQF